MNEPRFQKRTIFLIVYLVFAILPIYWMVNMSFKTNEEILSSFSLWPQQPTLLACWPTSRVQASSTCAPPWPMPPRWR